MKALRNLAAILLLITIQACSMSAPSSSGQANQTAQARLDKPDSIQPQTFVMRGEVVLGHEVRSITPCGSHQQYWLDMSEDRFRQALNLVRTPYAPLYGEVIGHLRTGQNDGFVADYSARFVVDSINILSAENPNRCDQPLKATRAFGTEPFWSLNFKNDALTFEKMGEQPRQLALNSSRIESDRRRYQFDGGSLELNQRSCSDGMSDSIYGWSTALQLDDVSYTGCATLSNQDATQNWTGTYHAQSTKTSSFSVTLKLLPDHSATTTYSYTSGESDSVESGYWQQLNSDQVQVVMTRHQQQSLISERIFTRDRYQLSTDQEKVGGVIYPIADGGLTLFKAEQTVKAIETEPKNPNDFPSSAEFNPKVDNAIREYIIADGNELEGTKYRWLEYDLNGDGSKELLVQLNWCGSGGCTMLIFENQQQEWRFNSRITLVRTPMNLGLQATNGWQDIVLFVSGGGATPNQHVLKFSNSKYPMNPSTAPVADYDQISPIQLFSDGQTPHQQGVAL